MSKELYDSKSREFAQRGDQGTIEKQTNMYKIITAITILLFLSSCAQNKQAMDELELEIMDEIISFKEKPYYTLQVNKQDCRVLVRVNDIPLWYIFFEDEGESMLLPINNILPKSGEQSITVEVYPKSFEQTLNDKAWVNVKLIYAPDRSTPMSDFEVMQELDLPEALADKKIPKYEIKGTFTATVPWDFSNDLKTAKDLSTVKNIDKKVVAKYNQIRQYLIDEDGYSFVKETKQSLLRGWNYNYFTKKELSGSPASKSGITDFSLKERKVLPLQDYEIEYYHNNKIALLRRTKGNQYAILVDSEEDISYSFICLYMPEGSNELKVW